MSTEVVIPSRKERFIYSVSQPSSALWVTADAKQTRIPAFMVFASEWRRQTINVPSSLRRHYVIRRKTCTGMKHSQSDEERPLAAVTSE